jgi:hypothetical protein
MYDDDSLTEPKHVATLDATLKSVVLDGYCCTIYCDIHHHNGMENIKLMMKFCLLLHFCVFVCYIIICLCFCVHCLRQ